MTFDESATPRDNSGKFAEKSGAAPEVALDPNTIDRGDGVTCKIWVGWSFASCRGCGWTVDTPGKAEAEVAAQAHRENPGYDEVVIEVGRLATIQKFMRDGVLHREGAPAWRVVGQPSGHGDYYVNGAEHRTDGPANFYGEYDESNAWYVEGERIELSDKEREAISYDMDTIFSGYSLTEDSLDQDDKLDVKDEARAKLVQMMRTRVLDERVRTMSKGSFSDE